MVIIDVNSTNIKQIGYDESKFMLFIKFTNNQMYTYRIVSVDVFKQFVMADSIGRYFWRNIRGKYVENKFYG